MHNEKCLFEVALGILYSTSKEGENTVESSQEARLRIKYGFYRTCSLKAFVNK